MNRPAFPWLCAGLMLLSAHAARAEGSQPASPSAGSSGWEHLVQMVHFSGIIDGEARWQRRPPRTTTSPAGSSTDLYLRQFNLGIEASLLQGASATAVLNSEWIGDYQNAGDASVSLDEVHFDIAGDDGGPYFVIGKRSQPSGLYESDQITDPVTQDAYETNRTAASIGYRGTRELDLSFTLYKGREQMAHLFRSGLFDTSMVSRDASDPRHVDSFIVAALASPWRDHLTTFASFLDEPGRGARNSSLDAGINLSLPFAPNVNLDLEGTRAVRRERYGGADRAYLDGALSIGGSYQFVVRKRAVHGSGTFRGRLSALRSRPVSVLARYEIFDDGGLATRLHAAWSLRDRWCVGGRYSFRDDNQVLAYAQGEYRHSRFRDGTAERAGDDEVYLRVGLSF